MRHIVVLLITIVCFFTIYSKSNLAGTVESKYDLESFGKTPGNTTEDIKTRLAALPTEIEMHYNAEVLSFINGFMKYGGRQVTSLLTKSAYYMPIFEEALHAAGLPDELKYLPIIESNLEPKATSPAGAAGLWQFMPVAAKGYDMVINSTLDERRDPYLSSERACRLLKDLYDRFGDWHLALAAYNAGAGTVQKAIKRAGGENKKHTFWSIYNYLPAETRKYVPKFIAITYVMNYYRHHNIPEVQVASNLATDTVKLSSRVSFREIASKVDISVDELRRLNPQFRTDMVPASLSRPCNLILPVEHAREYKLQLGRNVDFENRSLHTKTGVKGSLDGHTFAKQMKTSASADNKKSDKLRNWDNIAFEDVESKTMPGTFVRVPKKQTGISNK